MAEIAVRKGFEPRKAWMRIVPGSDGFFGIYLNRARTEVEYCKYHVAPLFEVEGVDHVFDPAFFAGPILLSEWEDRIGGYCQEYGHTCQTIICDWQNFFGPEQMTLGRKSAVETRDELLALSRNLEDPKIRHGVIAQARGDWIDSLEESDPEGFRAMVGRNQRGAFWKWLRQEQSPGDLEQLLLERETYYGLPCASILGRMDLKNPFVGLELRKIYWPYFLDLFDELQATRDAILNPQNSSDRNREMLFRSICGEVDEDGDTNYRKWFSRTGEDLWRRFGVDTAALLRAFESRDSG